jgi:murein DD-endopeptidase MepM/ murein hydrolase activator NlpD
MSGRNSGLITLLAFVIVFGGFSFLLYNNAQSTTLIQVVLPTQVTSTVVGNPWQQVLQPGFGNNTTAQPTLAIPTQRYNAPTLVAETGPLPTPLPAEELGNDELYTVVPVSTAMTPTPPPSSTPILVGDAPVTVQPLSLEPTDVWQPPPLEPPINLDPKGRDHYWFTRPIDSSGLNFGILYYMYGSDGAEANNPSRIHTGLDMPNDIGSTVRATGAGTVIFASSEENPYFQNTTGYGNVVVIEHEFGWQGQPLWTLYAHLQVSLVQVDDRVEAGDPIALSGNTGRSSGPHVHYEIRLGENRYGNSYNPVLWMVPYVGRGVIAGRLETERGNLIDDHTITLRSLATASIEGITTTYVFVGNVNDVNSDPNWNENFVFGDVPVGRYEVIATYSEQRISKIVEIREGMTTFVELKPVQPATAQPVTPEP